MERRELLIKLGNQIGHGTILEKCRAIVSLGNNDDSDFVKKFVDANENVDVETDGGEIGNDDGGCAGHEGQCGECRSGVWYPCT